MADVTIEMTLSTHQARAFLCYQLTQSFRPGARRLLGAVDRPAAPLR